MGVPRHRQPVLMPALLTIPQTPHDDRRYSKFSYRAEPHHVGGHDDPRRVDVDDAWDSGASSDPDRCP